MVIRRSFDNKVIGLKRHKSKIKRLKTEKPDQKHRKKVDDDNIKSSDSEEYGDRRYETAAELEEKESAAERVLDSFGEKIRAAIRREEEDDSDEIDERGGKEDEDRDSLLARRLQEQQLEENGFARRSIASRVHYPKTTDEFRLLVKHRQSVTAVVLSKDDCKVFSASKDGSIVQCDVDNGKTDTYGAKDPQERARKRSLALSVSHDGRYLASGGIDGCILLWDIRTRQQIQAFPGHKGPVSCLTFREGTSELFSGSYDRTVKIWNVEKVCYIETLFGHGSDVLAIDCLRNERVLTVGRDHTMRYWKVPEETQLVFCAPASSLECCCFISNDEFLSGSDDGSIQHWNVLRKKPLHIIKNAHSITTPKTFNDDLSNGCKETPACCWVSSVAVCRGSDLAASGAGNGVVRLWEIENEAKGIQPLFDLPLVGYVNSLAFAKSGKFLVAGVGKEPRLGRWGSIPAARHGVAVHPLQIS